MPNAKYNRGAHYERQTMQKLEREGYRCHRMAGSHGIYDVIAYNDKTCRLIQVKSTQKNVLMRVYRPDLSKMFLDETPINFTKELWVYGLVNGKKGLLKISVF